MAHKPVINQTTGAKGPDMFGIMFDEFCNEAIVMLGLGISAFYRHFWRNMIVCVSLLVLLHFVSRHIVMNNYHIQFVHDLLPNILTYKRLRGWTKNISPTFFVTFFFIVELVAVLIPLGIHLRWTRTKYQKIFLGIGLTNGEGETPILVAYKKIDKLRKQFTFDSKYIGRGEYETKRERLESAFEMKLDTITYGKTQRYVSLIFTTDNLPQRINLKDLLSEHSLKEGEFIVGKSSNGIIKQSIAELPHMLIAGSTGAGKSVYFKQTLVGLLKSTPHLQLYIIDLKRGLEAVDFKAAPNVAIVKTMADALTLLSKIKKKMESRFDYLERCGKKEIVPARDKMERIVVAVDESSVLHMKRDRQDPECDLAIQARSLIDSISKLSRAAAINLILATQKIDKETIPTTVQENISGRLAFKANTLQGSLIVLGNKDALELPDIAGRGIWKIGNRQNVIQAPYIGETEVKNAASEVEDLFKLGRRKLFEPLISLNQVDTKKSKTLDDATK